MLAEIVVNREELSERQTGLQADLVRACANGDLVAVRELVERGARLELSTNGHVLPVREHAVSLPLPPKPVPDKETRRYIEAYVPIFEGGRGRIPKGLVLL